MNDDANDAPMRDVVIVGGGLVGASLAAALASSANENELSLSVIEAAAVDALDDDGDNDDQPSFDARTVALTYDARQIYSGIGVWDRIAPRAQPITEIHISDRGHFGMAHLRSRDAGAQFDALGYVVPTRAIGAALHAQLRDNDAVEVLCPARVERIESNGAYNAVEVRTGDQRFMLRARLVVLADGGRSGLAAQLGIASPRESYRQSAIVTTIETDRDTGGRAFERFTDEGPLALLPHSARRYAVAWTSSPERAAARMALSDDDFAHALQRAFGDRAGRLDQPSARKCYPLQRGRAAHPVGARSVIIGDAAHIVHPVAGQGFNLGLRDVAALADAIRCADDPGDEATLARYAAARWRETARVGAFTDGLIRLFTSRRKSLALGLARGVALAGVELLPPIKRLLLRRTMGLHAARARIRNATNR